MRRRGLESRWAVLSWIAALVACCAAPLAGCDSSGARHSEPIAKHASPVIIVNQTQLVPTDDAQRVAVSGDLFAVADSVNKKVGIYSKLGGNWSLEQTLTNFSAHSFTANDLVVTDHCNAFVYSRAGTQWSQKQKLTINCWVPTGNCGGGISLASTPDTVAAGCSSGIVSPQPTGKLAFVRFYTKDTSGTWVQQGQVTGPPVSLGGAQFVAPLAVAGLHGDTLVATDAIYPGSCGFVTKQDRVFVYGRIGTTWSLHQQIIPPCAAGADLSIAVGDNVIVVGAPDESVGGKNNVGAIYTYTTTGSTWVQGEKIPNPDPALGGFGKQLALFGDILLTTGPKSGYLYTRSPGSWTLYRKLTTNPDQGTLVWSRGAVGLAADTAAILFLGKYQYGQYEEVTAVFDPGGDVGDSCSVSEDCKNLHCSDGKCCDTACSGQCDVCSKAAGASQDGVCTALGPGATGTPSCAPYLCGGSATCPTMCVNASQCASGNYCNSSTGKCELKQSNGASCTKDGAISCSSGQCVDGVCCNSACTGVCQGCSAAAKGQGANGTCGPVVADADPADECPSNPGAFGCGPDGLCNGAGACRPYAKAGIGCGQGNVCDQNQVSGSLCDGLGVCQQTSKVACDPYKCVSGKCNTTCVSQTDCGPGAYCTPLGTCQLKLTNGKGCSGAVECTSGFCVDGFCCDQLCGQQCEACNVVGSEGVCSASKGEPVGSRPKCSATDVSCKGSCDGQKHDGCTYPGPLTSCGTTTCAAAVMKPQVCDGAGNCANGTPVNCDPYSCDTAGSACNTSCTTSMDCISGALCNPQTGECGTGTTCKDPFTVVDASSTETDCKPYKCDAGVCRDSCTTTVDCAPGYECTGSKCVANGTGGAGGVSGAGGAGGSSASAGSGGSAGSAGAAGATGGSSSGGASDSGGCGCRVPAKRRGSSLPVVLGLITVLVASKRRRYRCKEGAQA